MQKKSLGLIETWGHIPAVEAADAGCKAANVVLAGYEEVRAGLVTIMFTGDVAAVKTAVTAGATAAKRVGKVVSCHVIARPDRQLQSLQPPPLPPESESTEQPQVPPPTALEGDAPKPLEEAPVEKEQYEQPKSETTGNSESETAKAPAPKTAISKTKRAKRTKKT